MHYILLCCIVLCCTVLYCIVLLNLLYCTYCIVLHCIVLYCIVLYCIVFQIAYDNGFVYIMVLNLCSTFTAVYGLLLIQKTFAVSQ